MNILIEKHVNFHILSAPLFIGTTEFLHIYCVCSEDEVHLRNDIHATTFGRQCNKLEMTLSWQSGDLRLLSHGRELGISAICLVRAEHYRHPVLGWGS